MRTVRLALSLLGALALTSGCGATHEQVPPPEWLYFPTGLFHLDDPTGGVLYVVSADFDKRYDFGQVTAIKPVGLTQGTDTLGACGQGVIRNGAPSYAPAASFIDLHTTEANRVLIDPFGGDLEGFGDINQARLFVPSRAEDDRLPAIDASGTSLSCHFISENGDSGRCAGDVVPSLTSDAIAGSDGKPRAAQPSGLSVASDHTVYVTHLSAADSPEGSGSNRESYLVAVNGDDPVVNESSFISIGSGASHAVAAGSRYAFVAGREFPDGNARYLIRAVDRTRTEPVLNMGLESSVGLLQMRGIELNSTQTKLYAVGRFPDQLTVMGLDAATTGSPRARLLRSLPVQTGPTQLKLIPNAPRGDLLAVSMTGSNSLLLYDDADGAFVAEVSGVAAQPFDIAVDRCDGPGARLYVSDFEGGRVTVVDIPDLAVPQNAFVVAHLGRPQSCLTGGGSECKP